MRIRGIGNKKFYKMTLKEFYRMICNEFNDWRNLEYKWTRPDGYWRMTKGFINTGNKELSLHTLAKFLQEEKEMKKTKETKPTRKKTKKPYIKYKGDTYGN